jgi:hypothetical protein
LTRWLRLPEGSVRDASSPAGRGAEAAFREVAGNTDGFDDALRALEVMGAPP